ncbi:MAG: mechanosensitive ion channel domain-containing protein [Hellea sp.]
MKTAYHIILSWSLTLCYLFGASAFAQTTPDDAATASKPVAASAQAVEEPESQSEIDTDAEVTSSIDLSDPALIEALDAREKADRAIAEAVKAQQVLASSDAATGDETAPKKPSLIPTSLDDAKALGKKVLDKVIGWLTSISFLAQVGAIVLAVFLSPILAGILRKRVFLFRDEPQKDVKLKVIRGYIYRSQGFLRAIFLVALLSLLAIVLKAVPVAGQDWLVKLAQGAAVVFLLYRMIKTFLPNPLVQKLALWIIIPLAVLMVFGFYDNLIDALKGTTLMTMGDTPITAMTMVRLAIFGSIFFYLGNFSNAKGQNAIRSQEGLDAGVREIAAKLFQIALFIIMFVLILSTAGIPLSGLVVIFSAVGLGIGFGLQPIAANFISGLIILFDRSVKVGDFVSMEEDQFGRVKAINMRSTTVATADGIDIIVPNTSFTENAYENWTHDSPLQRYEVDFSVSYTTDLDALVPLMHDAVLEHEDVLSEPDMPSVEFRSFGENGINMCVEFWCEGVDDGPNKFTSDVGFIIWRTLKANKIEIPFPQRVITTLNR